MNGKTVISLVVLGCTLFGAAVGIVSTVWALDTKMDSKISSAMDPVVDRMDRIDRRVEKTNDLLLKVLNEVRLR